MTREIEHTLPLNVHSTKRLLTCRLIASNTANASKADHRSECPPDCNDTKLSPRALYLSVCKLYVMPNRQRWAVANYANALCKSLTRSLLPAFTNDYMLTPLCKDRDCQTMVPFGRQLLGTMILPDHLCLYALMPLRDKGGKGALGKVVP